MLGLLLILFAILVAAGALLYFVHQELAGWIVAVFASGLAGALVAELFTRERIRRDGEDPSSPGDSPASVPGGGGDVPGGLGDDGDRPESDGGGTDAPGHVERGRRGRTVHRGRSTWELFLGFRRYRK